MAQALNLQNPMAQVQSSLNLMAQAKNPLAMGQAQGMGLIQGQTASTPPNQAMNVLQTPFKVFPQGGGNVDYSMFIDLGDVSRSPVNLKRSAIGFLCQLVRMI